MSENENGSKFHCPYCRGKRLQVATSTNFSTSTSVTRKQVTTTVESSNMRYWVCQDCGGTFPFPQDLQAKAEDLQKNAKSTKNGGIVCVTLGTLCLPVAAIPGCGFVIALSIMLWILSGFMFAIAPAQSKEAEKIYGEYAQLISKCMDD